MCLFRRNRRKTALWEGENGKVYIIFGLGNPGRKYAGTRHNVGFDAVTALADAFGIKLSDTMLKGLSGRGIIAGQRVILVQPQTFMNLSGEAVGEAARFYKVPPEQILVLCDDISLEPGKLRLRVKGSAGGHNGLKSIIANVGTQGFTRIRVGVGAKVEGEDLADHVLGHFNKDDAKIIEIAAETAAEAIKTMLTDGVDKAMNKFNTKKRKDDASTTDPA